MFATLYSDLICSTCGYIRVIAAAYGVCFSDNEVAAYNRIVKRDRRIGIAHVVLVILIREGCPDLWDVDRLRSVVRILVFC